MSRDALVVGINVYSYEGLNNLKAPAQDAEAIAKLLEEHGDFKVTRLPAIKDYQNITPKIGQKNKVDLANLEDAIEQLFMPDGKSSPDTALLYFSGHGLRKSKRRLQEGYLATSDVNPDLGNWGIRLKWLREVLQESEVKQQIIILDCCYSGELLNFTEADPGDRGKGRDRCFIAASRSFEVAYEEIDNRHSVFTAALIKGLEPLSDRWVTNYTLVDRLSQQHNSFPQRPIYFNSGETINFTRIWTQTSQKSTAPSTAVCPYKGLRYFDYLEEDAKFFYGRTTLTDKLLEKLRVGNFLAVLGASGSGKSSIVRAGLLYQLKLGRRLSGSQSWIFKIFKPGEHPLESLALAFLDTESSVVECDSKLVQTKELIAKGAYGLKQLVTSLIVEDTRRLVLVVDQFEEVFTLCKNNEERQKFFECLLGALQQCSNKLCLVLTMRSDFFGKCTEQEYSGLAQQIQHNLVTVTPMTQEELQQAIIEPAKQVKLKIEPELVKEMLADVANAPGTLPLLQDTLTELWNKRSDNYLRVKTYSQLGGLMGTLQKRATRMYESLSEEEKLVCKHIFLALTQLGEGTEDTRKRCFKKDLVNKRYSVALIDEVIRKLADEKLIVTSEVLASGSTSDRIAVVDVVHEALIRHWTLLRKWIEESRERIIRKRVILSMITELQKCGKVNLSNTNLSSTDLSDANLADTNFSGANLADANFSGANLADANFSDANLADAVLSMSNIRNANLTHANLINADLSDVNLSSANFSDSNLTDTSLGGSKFRGVNLSGANLSGANLSGANLSGANFSGANLSNANLIDANLSDAKLSGVNCTSANLNKTNLRNVNLSDANLTNAILIDADLSAVNLSGANLSGANFAGINLSGVNLNGANFAGVNFSNANLKEVNLRRANLSNANLSGANLHRANLHRADLCRTDFTGADLRHADLSNANLTGTNLSDADLSHTKLSNLLYDKETKFPQNFNPENKNMYLMAPGVRLSGAYLNDVNLIGIDLSNASLTDVNLASSNLSDANLTNTDFTNSNLSNTNFTNADLTGSNLTSVDLSNVNLTGANLTGANLTGANLTSANLMETNLNNANLNGTKFWYYSSHLFIEETKNITPKQIKQAKNWEKAIYSFKFRTELGLPPEK